MDNQNTTEEGQNSREAKSKGDSFLVPIPERKLVCVEYPGRVVNVKRALETLGGEERITDVNNSSNQRLPLHFRPDDIYSRPVFGNRYSTTNMLLKVTKKKGSSSDPSGPQASSSTQGDDEYTCEMMGIVDSTYKFEGMCDYQYLPIQSKADGSFKSVLHDLVPDTPEDKSFLDKEPQPDLFMVPGNFSRMDKPSNYLYQKPSTGYVPPIHENLIGKRRKRRPGTAYLVPFDTESIPTEPQEEAVESVKRLNLREELELLRKLFQERPMYSRIALAVCSKLPLNILRTLLPAVAYYFLSGPWRTTWCRLGFDPRDDSCSRMYQVVDFRIRKHVLSKAREVIQPLVPVRGLFNVPAKQTRRDQKGASVPIEENDDRPPPCEAGMPYTEANYILKEGVLPAHYQMCYQFCDLHVKELQDIITAAEVRKTCHPRHGWWDPDLCNRLRNEMSRIVERTVLGVLQENDGAEPDDVAAVVGEDGEGVEPDEVEDGYDRAEDSSEEDEGESDNEEDTELLEYLEPMDTVLIEPLD